VARGINSGKVGTVAEPGSIGPVETGFAGIEDEAGIGAVV
jgi:hypothetical protein